MAMEEKSKKQEKLEGQFVISKVCHNYLELGLDSSKLPFSFVKDEIVLKYTILHSTLLEY